MILIFAHLLCLTASPMRRPSRSELVGLVIERVSGLSYAGFLQKNIWDPLGMSQTYYLDTTRIIKQRASGYTSRDGVTVNANPYTMNRIYAAGALGSTVLDLMKWQRALLENRLISAATFKKMTTHAKLNDGTPVPYGYGLFLLELEGKRKNEHYGSLSGFRAQLAHYPSDDLTVSVLANANPARTEVLESRIARAMMDIPEATVKELLLTPEQLKRYAGTYLVQDAPITRRSNTTQIDFRNDGLYAGQFRLRPIGGDVFVPAGDPYHRYIFAMRNGETVRLRVEREGAVLADAPRQN